MQRFLRLALLAIAYSPAISMCAQDVSGTQTGSETIRSSSFAVVLQSDGVYQVTVERTGWTLSGSLPKGFTVLPPSSGSDHLGRYQEVRARSAGRLSSIRIYDGRPLVYFADTWERAGLNAKPFPSFDAMPYGATRYSFKGEAFAPFEFNRLGTEGPWIFFDHDNALVLSPSDHYQVSVAELTSDGHATMGINPKIQTLPEGFVHGVVLGVGDGVNSAMQVWGSALQALGGKHAYANENDDDPVSSSLGYWTAKGAAYFNRSEPALGYTGTLLRVKESFASSGFPLGYMQLDNWLYPQQSERSAQDLFRVSKKILPDGLDAFHRVLGLPLEIYGGWATPSHILGPLSMSGNVVIDHEFWKASASFLKECGAITYEQGGLATNARTELTLTAPSDFLGNMASAMKQQGITVQYGMASPSDYMASTQYGNLATIQTSGDRFDRTKWDTFLYDSRMATSLGAQPWTGVFMSSELGNLLVATLSGGPVGVGDALGKTSVTNLDHSVRSNGDLVKPEVGLRPIDRMYLEDAASKESPMIAVATSGPPRHPTAYYVFAYARKPSDHTALTSLSELGIGGQALVYDWVRKTAAIVAQDKTVTIKLNGTSVDTVAGAGGTAKMSHWGYLVIVPYSQQGVGIIGDPAKFATLGTSWESRLDRLGKSPEVLVDFAGDDRPRALTGYATHRPILNCEKAEASLSRYDEKTGFFLVTVTPGKAERALVSID